MTIFSVYLTFFIGICKYICVCTDVFENEIRKLNHIQFRRPSNLIKTHSQLRSHLIDLVEFHQKIFELMDQVQQLMSGPFFKQLCIYTIFIGHSLHSRVTNSSENPLNRYNLKIKIVLLFTFQDIKEYTFDVLLAINALFLQTVFNFIICYFADTVTSASLNVADTLYNVDWFEFPVKEQQMISFMIRRAQIPFHFRGNNSITCSMQTLLRVSGQSNVMNEYND